MGKTKRQLSEAEEWHVSVKPIDNTCEICGAMVDVDVGDVCKHLHRLVGSKVYIGAGAWSHYEECPNGLERAIEKAKK